MPWTIILHEAALDEMNEQATDIRVRFDRIVAIIEEHGLEKLPPKLTKHIDGELWEFRLKGMDGIARAFYVTRRGQRIFVVRVFTKKTQKTPRREIELALERAEEMT